MKARSFRRMRKNLKNRKWVEKKLSKLFKEYRELDSFYHSECSDYFRGKPTKATEHNLEIYYKGNRKNARQMSFVNRMLEEIK